MKAVDRVAVAVMTEWDMQISTSICIHWKASGGYYGFHFVTPPLQCIERFYHYRSNKKIL